MRLKCIMHIPPPIFFGYPLKCQMSSYKSTSAIIFVRLSTYDIFPERILYLTFIIFSTLISLLSTSRNAYRRIISKTATIPLLLLQKKKKKMKTNHETIILSTRIHPCENGLVLYFLHLRICICHPLSLSCRR